MARLELDRISKRYGTKQVLQGISLQVPDGSFCAMLGPSGSGKSTIVRVVAGFTAPSAGEVLVDGRQVTDLAPHRREIGVVFQSYALFPHMSVFDNVAFGLRMRRIDRTALVRRVRSMLRLVNLAEMEHRRPSELSGGQQQRVALARALVIEPQLLLLDEPLSALDRQIRQEMRMELKRIHRDTGVTTIIVTHDQEEALYLADQMLVLEEGRVRQLGRPTDIYQQPADASVAHFMGSEPLPPGELTRDEDGWTVRINRIRLPIPPPKELVTGQRVQVAIQPEYVSVTPHDSHDQLSSDHLIGVLRDVDLFGPIARGTVEIDGLVIPIFMLSTVATQLRPEQRVSVTVNPSGVHCFATQNARGDGD
jgi:ABC-type Fe3+/spermidine/putrescine transport system ATPase subunit